MRRIIILFFSCFSILGLRAQYDMNAFAPLNPKVRQGQLANGLTYFICRNTQPQQKADFYIVQKVGALMENKEQNGLAHFLEHMAFNGTKHFPGDMVWETMKKHGVNGGSHVNASTGYNETVYRLSNVPVTNEGLADTCLLILYDWAHYLSLEEESADKERKIVLEEARTTSNVGKRLSEKSMSVLLKGSKYVEHNVIGNPEVIRNFKMQTLVDYYHQWYRPELQAIIVVGDFDPEEMEQKVKDLFSRLPTSEQLQSRPFFPITLSGEETYVLAVDKEVPYSFVSLNILSEDTKPELKNHQYMRDFLVESLYGLMFSSRLNSLTAQKNTPCLAVGSKISPLVRGYRTYSITTTAQPEGEAKALEMVYTENERLRRFGFTGSELEMAKIALQTGFRSTYDSKDNIENKLIASELREYFLNNEPAPGFEYYYRFAEAVIPTITVEEVSAKAKKWVTHKNMVISIAGPKDAPHLTKGEVLAILKKVEKTDLQPYEKEVEKQAGELIAGKLKGGKIAEEKEIPSLEATEWILDNEAKVFFRKADAEKEQIVVTAYSKGGTSLCNPELLPSAMMLGKMMPAYGLGSLNAKKLSQYLTGKKVSLSVSLDNTSESVSGVAAPEELETLMQMLYLSFEKPRFDPMAHEIMMQQAKATVQPSPVNDSLQMILNDYHPRVMLYNHDFLDRVTLDKIEKVYRDRIQDASDFTFLIVGNTEVARVRPLVEKYIGSIRSTYRKENWRDNGVRCPQGTIRKVIGLEGSQPKSTVMAIYSKEMKYSVRDNFYFGVLQSILYMRAIQSIRGKAGGTYYVDVKGNSQQEPYSGYNLSISFDCDPARSKELKTILTEEIGKLIQQGPRQDELVQVVITLRNQYEQAKQHNSYWINALTMLDKYGVDITDPKNYNEIIDYMTTENIRDFAARFFTAANLMDITFVTKGK